MAMTVEEAVQQLAGAVDSKVAAALEDIDGTEPEKAVIAERYRQVLRDNLRQGLVTVFGLPKEQTAGAAADLGAGASYEVTPEDLDEEFNAFDNVVSRRKRYPEKASQALQTTLQSSRRTLRALQVPQTGVGHLETGGLGEYTGQTQSCLQDTVSSSTSSRALAAETEKRAGQLVAAARILTSTEGALQLLM